MQILELRCYYIIICSLSLFLMLDLIFYCPNRIYCLQQEGRVLFLNKNTIKPLLDAYMLPIFMVISQFSIPLSRGRQNSIRSLFAREVAFFFATFYCGSSWSSGCRVFNI